MRAVIMLSLGETVVALQTPTRRFLLARHGETYSNAEGRIQGTLDTELNENGLWQAEGLGDFVAANERIDAVWCSPQTRARQTLAKVAEATSLPEATIRDDLREINLYDWQGRLKSEVAMSDPAGWQLWKSAPEQYRTSGGEAPLLELWDRAQGNWRALLDAPSVPTTLVVAHGALGRCMVAAALGCGLSGFTETRFHFDNCCVFELVFHDDAATATTWRKLYPQPTEARTAAEARTYISASPGALQAF